MPIVSRPQNELHHRRVGDLACLPVFLTLNGKKALVAGGSDAAAWKAELLAATGATVLVYAERASLDGEMSQLIARNVVTIGGASWRDADWSELALAVGDIGEDEAAGFVGHARRAGVPVNVIDKPAFCQFQFGSIVNRSPVVVGISTNGAAPILGQAVRRRIESLLPASLGTWGRLAQTVRPRVTASLQPGAQRRAFWEALADAAFHTVSSDAPVDRWLERAREAPKGYVTMVGAGPGDPDLLTIKAVRALQSADVILYDDEISHAILELARREARRIPLGTGSGQSLTIELAEQGRRVVRLVPGDAQVAGADLAAIKERGIPVEMVPGVAKAPSECQRAA